MLNSNLVIVSLSFQTTSILANLSSPILQFNPFSYLEHLLFNPQRIETVRSEMSAAEKLMVAGEGRLSPHSGDDATKIKSYIANSYSSFYHS